MRRRERQISLQRLVCVELDVHGALKGIQTWVGSLTLHSARELGRGRGQITSVRVALRPDPLGCYPVGPLQFEVGLPIQIGRLNVRHTMGVRRAQQDAVSRDELTVPHADDLADPHVPPDLGRQLGGGSIRWNKIHQLLVLQSIGLSSSRILHSILDGRTDDHEGQRNGHGRRPRRIGNRRNHLQDAQKHKIDVRHPLELLEQVLREEIPQSVLGGTHFIGNIRFNFTDAE
mmetsp:Transcript_47802/g.126559  ORF Transcript_47802/g.126559 Transcript_47802/m.126559 type:complete len:231 (+) Transcript_47802:3293-3985(+)